MGLVQHITALCLALTCSTTMVNAQEVAKPEPEQPINSWQFFEPGLEFGVFLAPQPAAIGDSRIRALRMDPESFELRLLNASATKTQRLYTAKEWCLAYNLVAAINASMYQKDYLSSVSLMRTQGHVNNPRLSKDNAILAFDRQTPTVPLVKIIDRQCDNIDEWATHYATLIQSIRMISCKGRNVWRQQPRKWSTALIATDTAHRVLFIHVRSLYSTHDLINILQQLPLNIARAMYTEGGREAQLAIRSYGQELEFVGTYGGGLGATNHAPPIPNVIGIVRRE